MTIPTLILIVFVLGYIAIALEHSIKIDKAASALFIGGLCWALFAFSTFSLFLAGSIWEGEVQGYKSKHSEKYDNFESCAHLIWQWNSYEMNFQPVK